VLKFSHWYKLNDINNKRVGFNPIEVYGL